MTHLATTAGYSGRAAVSAVFFANGLMFGTWAPKLPVLMQRLNIDESTAAFVVLMLGIGSVALMPVFGAAVARHGSSKAVRISSVLSLPTLILITLAPNLVTVMIAVLLFGGMLGGMDIAMNSNAVAAERAYRRAIMSSCHGFWSLGGVVGAGLGGIILAKWGEMGHAVTITFIFAATLAIALPRILNDAPSEAESTGPLRLPRSPMPYVIGLIALCSMVPEGAIIDWAAVYLQRELGAPLSLAGFGFAACAAAMAAMRFVGDMLRQKLGPVSMMRVSAVIAMTGLGIAGMAPNAYLAIFGFGFAGIGISNLVPIAFSAAGNLPSLSPGIGMSVVTMMGYSGILLAPGIIGFLAESIGFSSVYLGLAALLCVPLLLSPLTRFAGFADNDARE